MKMYGVAFNFKCSLNKYVVMTKNSEKRTLCIDLEKSFGTASILLSIAFVKVCKSYLGSTSCNNKFRHLDFSNHVRLKFKEIKIQTTKRCKQNERKLRK